MEVRSVFLPESDAASAGALALPKCVEARSVAQQVVRGSGLQIIRPAFEHFGEDLFHLDIRFHRLSAGPI